MVTTWCTSTPDVATPHEPVTKWRVAPSWCGTLARVTSPGRWWNGRIRNRTHPNVEPWWMRPIQRRDPAIRCHCRKEAEAVADSRVRRMTARWQRTMGWPDCSARYPGSNSSWAVDSAGNASMATKKKKSCWNRCWRSWRSAGSRPVTARPALLVTLSHRQPNDFTDRHRFAQPSVWHRRMSVFFPASSPTDKVYLPSWNYFFFFKVALV